VATSVTTFTISGAVSGTVERGVTVTLSGSANSSVTTDASGNYAFTGLSDGSYMVTPSLATYTYPDLLEVRTHLAVRRRGRRGCSRPRQVPARFHRESCSSPAAGDPSTTKTA